VDLAVFSKNRQIKFPPKLIFFAHRQINFFSWTKCIRFYYDDEWYV